MTSATAEAPAGGYGGVRGEHSDGGAGAGDGDGSIGGYGADDDAVAAGGHGGDRDDDGDEEDGDDSDGGNGGGDSKEWTATRQRTWRPPELCADNPSSLRIGVWALGKRMKAGQPVGTKVDGGPKTAPAVVNFPGRGERKSLTQTPPPVRPKRGGTSSHMGLRSRIA